MNVVTLILQTAFAAVMLFAASSALAGPLAGDIGISYFGSWAGSSPFEQGTLKGYVDWAVYGPGAFPYAGYTPTPGQLTYAYQVYVTGAAPLLRFDVDLSNPGNHIGTFVLPGGTSPTSQSIGSVAVWDFAGVPSGENTVGLAFSSHLIPLDWFGTVTGSGAPQSPFYIPIPSTASPFPEPASVVLLGLGGTLLVGARCRKALTRPSRERPSQECLV